MHEPQDELAGLVQQRDGRNASVAAQVLKSGIERGVESEPLAFLQERLQASARRLRKFGLGHFQLPQRLRPSKTRAESERQIKSPRQPGNQNLPGWSDIPVFPERDPATVELV